jgi:hypothetical protein
MYEDHKEREEMLNILGWRRREETLYIFARTGKQKTIEKQSERTWKAKRDQVIIDLE